MKKFALFALAALCVSAAQAVTSSWSNWTDVTDSPSVSGTTGLSSDASAWYKQSAFAVQVTYTFSLADVSNGTYLLGLRSGNGSQFYGIRFPWNGNTTITAVQQNGIDWTIDQVFTPVADADGNVTITALLAYNNQRLEAYVNDQYIGYTTFNSNDWPEYDGRQISVSWGADPTNTNSSTMLSTATISDLQYSTTLVPEPTALALLALGVAGLALKRKIA